MQKKRIVIIISAIIGLLLLVIMFRPKENSLPKVQEENGLWTALQELLEAENLSMKMDLKMDIGEKKQDLSTKVYLVQDDDKKFFVVEYEDFPIYVIDNLLLLENGKAFKISEEKEQPVVENEMQNDEKGNVFQQIAAAYKMFEITCTQKGEETLFEIMVTGEQVERLLSEMIPLEQEMIRNVEKIQLTLVIKDGMLQRVEVSGVASVKEEMVQLDIVISEFKVLAEGEYKIPEIVKEKAANAEVDTLFCLTEDLYPLLKASQSIQALGEQDGTVHLSAKCGLINVNLQLRLLDLKSGTSEVENSKEIEQIPEMILLLCLESEISCMKNEDAYEYRLRLEEEAVKKISEMIVPELAEYRVSFTEGTAVLVLEEQRVSSIAITIKGDVDMYMVDVPLAIGVEFVFDSF